MIAQGIKQTNNLIRMLIKSGITLEANYAKASLQTWHERLGHVNRNSIEKMVRNNAVLGITVTDDKHFFCESCPSGKQFKLPFNKSEKNVNVAPGEVIHTDLCGPMQTPSIGNAKFFLLFKDESSGFRTVYFLRHKCDTYDFLKDFVNATKTHFGAEIKIILSDNGTEYDNAIVKGFLKARGIQLLMSAPYTPEQNGRAERKMRTIVECARTMLLARDLPMM